MGWGFLAILLCSLIKVMTQAQELIPPTSTYTARYTHARAHTHSYFAMQVLQAISILQTTHTGFSLPLGRFPHVSVCHCLCYFISSCLYVPIITFPFPFSICSFFTLPPSSPYNLFILYSVSPFQKHFK